MKQTKQPFEAKYKVSLAGQQKKPPKHHRPYLFSVKPAAGMEHEEARLLGQSAFPAL